MSENKMLTCPSMQTEKLQAELINLRVNNSDQSYIPARVFIIEEDFPNE